MISIAEKDFLARQEVDFRSANVPFHGRPTPGG